MNPDFMSFQRELAIISGSWNVFGIQDAILVSQNLAHSFDCDAEFQLIQTDAKLKVVAHINLQLLEFNLDVKTAIQIILPLASNFLPETFQTMGFEIFDALLNVPGSSMNILFPIVAMKQNFKVKTILESSGLKQLLSDNEDEEQYKNIKDVQQFNIFSIFPTGPANSTVYEILEPSVIVNRPFLFRLVDATSQQPLLVGYFSCPIDDFPNTHQESCASLINSCRSFNFCSRLEDICSAWNSCTV